MPDTVAIFAGGPSLTRETCDKVVGAGIYSVAINNSWTIAPDADVLLAADPDWWMEYREAMSFTGEKIVMVDRGIPGLTVVKPEPIGRGSNSALQAAYWQARGGAKRILLFGVDLRDDELTHHYGQHRGDLAQPNRTRFDRARKAWAEFARKRWAEVINCSERSALTCFPKMPLSEVL